MPTTEKSIQPLKLKNSTKHYFKKAKIKEAIISEVQMLPSFDKELKFDNEIIEAILQTIDDKFYKKTKEERKLYAIDILNDLFSLSPDEINIITKNITYMYENKIIKKPSRFFKATKHAFSFILKKA